LGICLRVATYNVHGCIGLDRRRRVERVAEAVASLDADIIALQETLGPPNEQISRLAALVGMQYCFGGSRNSPDHSFGNAVLARRKLSLVRHSPLPRVAAHEQRSALWVRVDVGVPLDVISTHLSLDASERAMQVRHLCGTDWLSAAHAPRHRILLADMNARPRDDIHRLFGRRLRNAQPCAPQATWPSLKPLLALDHCYVSPKMEVRSVHVPRGGQFRWASDHLPLCVDIELAHD
jgi:endonuclease/exonuclease/phosphatase family metal-dependent hydrolase